MKKLLLVGLCCACVHSVYAEEGVMLCNEDTKAGETAYINYMHNDFETVKALAINVYPGNEHASRIEVTCTDDGWANPVVTRCFVPYVATQDGICVDYTSFLTNNLESLYGMSYDEHKEYLGMSDEDYYNYRSGNVNSTDLYYMMMQDPVLEGRFEVD